MLINANLICHKGSQKLPQTNEGINLGSLLYLIEQGFSNLPARQICWQKRLFKLAGEVFSKKSLPLKKNHYQFFSKSLPIFPKITTNVSKNHFSANDFFLKITTKSLLYDYVEDVRSDFIFKKIFR